MRCCASYRISFHLYQSGLLGRVPNRCPVATACLSKWAGRAGAGPARIVPPDQHLSAAIHQPPHLPLEHARMRLLRDSTLLKWRAVAKDRMDLPPDQRIEDPSEIEMGMGETYDFDFVPSGTGDTRLDITNVGGPVLVSMPIRVR